MISGSGRDQPSHSPDDSGARERHAGGEASPARPTPGTWLAIVIAAIAATGLVLITIVSPGATRMHAWPWSAAYTVTLLAPALLLLLRAFNRSEPLQLPSRAWYIAAFGAAASTLASAFASPYREMALLWSAPALSSLALFLVVFDWLQRGPRDPGERAQATETQSCLAVNRRRGVAWNALLGFFGIVAIASIVEWAATLGSLDLDRIAAVRNPFPLGHSNYTAGLALLMAPAFTVAAWRNRGLIRWLAATGLVLALAMLFTSGSRGGVIALCVPAVIGIVVAPVRRTTKLRIGAVALLAGGVFIAANPRTRAMFGPAETNAAPNISNVQRSAMVDAGLSMGSDRPALGWGFGTTPLVYPRYRQFLDGGAENVLQLHSLPVQVWAELGLAGVAAAVFGIVIMLANRRRDPLAFVTLAGYLVFSVFDAQLDVPIFALAIATLAAFVASPRTTPQDSTPARLTGAFVLACLAAVVVFGRADPTPVLNSRALSEPLAREQPQKAIALLKESLALNPDQEIAHFNLGWLRVAGSPAEAASHFIAAAHLVPDKGGVYLGLGLARMNEGKTDEAARAFALEALNDPTFLVSPWWKTPQLAAVKADTLRHLDLFILQLQTVRMSDWRESEARYVQALAAWVAGGSADAVLHAANTPERRAFFANRPSASVLTSLGSRTMRYERPGYPVLMRNLDLPVPRDVYVAQESTARDSTLAHLWPEKGWLRSSLLIALLDGWKSPQN